MKKTLLLKTMLLLFGLIVGSSSVWATDYVEAYTFSITKPSSGAVSDYTKSGEMTISGIKWNVPGNWYATGALRLGGKSLSNVDRVITGKGVITDEISKITVNHSGVTSDNMIVNSVTITVASDASFTQNLITKTVTPSIKKNKADSFDLTPDVICPANRYYKITFNFSNSNNSNYAFVLNSIVFYKEDSTVKYTLSSGVTPANSGTVSLDATSLAEGGETGITATPESGYAFSSWTVTGEGASVENANAASTIFTMGNENATVTANFTEVNYWVVTYDYNDGVTANEEVQVLKDAASSYTLKATPSRENFIFTGWKIDETTYAAGDAYEPTGNVTAQAQWEFNGTLITYNKSDMDDIATGAKYIMVGSNTSSNVTTWKFATAMGNETYLHASVVGEYGTLDAEKAKLFDETPEIITLNETAEGWTMTTENGKIGIGGDKKVYYDQGDMTWDLDATDDNPTFSATYNSSDYTMQFNWNSGNSRFTGYTSSQKMAYFYRLDDGKEVYTLTLDFNDGATADGEHRVLEGAAYTLTTPTRSGYAFIGWNTEEDGTGTNYLAGAYTMPAAATTLYAQWSTTIPATIPAGKEWITFCSAANLDFSEAIEGLKGAYTITNHESAATTLTATKMTGAVKAGTGLLLRAAEKKDVDQVITIPVAATGDEQTDNMLIGVTEDTPIQPSEGDYTNLGLSNGAFHPYSAAGTLAAGKAYLQILTAQMPTAGNNAKLIIVFDGEATGIANLNVDVNDNFDANAPMYNLAGQRVNKSYKGVVIVNGKKVVRK